LPLAELRLAYASADVVVVPSLYEPFGLVALEAQRIGTAVAVAKTGGLAETLPKTGGGVFFPPGDANGLAQVLERLLQNPSLRQKLGSEGQQAVEKHFTWPGLTRALDGVYQSALGAGPPKPLTPEFWKAPKAVQKVQAPQPSSQSGEPLTDIVLFWGAAAMADLRPILERLAEAHALKALGGKIHVIPVALGDNSGKAWGKPIEHERIRYPQPNELPGVWRCAALVVAQADLMEPLCHSQAITPPLIPTVWLDKGQPTPHGGWVVSNLSDLYFLTNKLLCDDRLRAVLAPQLARHIPQVHWRPPKRQKPEILHVVPQIVTGGAETTLLELIKGTSADFSHRILCIGPLEGPLPGELREAGADIVQVQNNLEGILRAILECQPDLLHLHNMSYVPGWLSAHRRLAQARIVETEHVVNLGSGHFGPVDLVACVSKAARAAHAPYEPALRGNAPRFEVVYNGISLKDYQNLPSKEEARQRLGLPLDRPIVGRVSCPLRPLKSFPSF
jgi:hypothetical protein